MRALLFENAVKNDYVNGRCTGYTVAVHNGYYRNYALSQIEKLALTVDGEAVPAESVRFVYQDKSYTWEQLADQYMSYWEVEDEAYLRVEKRGGLPAGEHSVRVELRIRIAYVPMPFTPETKSTAHSYWVPVYTDEKKYIC